MSEQDQQHIRENLKVISAAVLRMDAVPPVPEFIALLCGMLVDINRIADALEHIARNMPTK